MTLKDEDIFPKKFLLHISRCGTDIENSSYSQIEHDNPILLGLKGVNIMANGMVKSKMDSVYKYLLACSILNGLDFKKENLLNDIEELPDRIKGFSLKVENF
jgi:hypothetical protein